MKKIFIYIVTLILSAGLVASCDLNILPTGSTTGEQMRTSPSGIQDLITGSYYTMITRSGNNCYIRQYAHFSDFSSDDVVYGHETEDELNMIFRYDERHAGLGNVNSFWSQTYKIVYACNTALGIAKKVEDPTPEIYYYMGEATFLKAFVYHCLLRLYAVPYDPATAASEPGIIFRDNEYDGENKARVSIQESYDEIIRLLEEAEDYFSKGSSSRSSDKAFGSLPAVYGLLSRVYLYMQDWDKCIEYSDKALGGKSTIPASDFRLYFTNTAGSAETIWCLKFTPDQDLGEASIAGMVYKSDKDGDWGLNWKDTKTCWGEEGYSASLFDAMGGYDSDEYNADIRSCFVQPPHEQDGLQLCGCMKPCGQDGSNTLYSPAYIRCAEMILNKAEAYAHKGDVTNALKFVNEIRSKRFTEGDYTIASSAANTGNILDIVLKERRIEFAFEGVRFYDLRRNHIDIVRNYWGFHTNTYNAGGTDKPEPGLSADGVVTKWNDPKLTLPIPQQELNNNPLAVQNPGY